MSLALPDEQYLPQLIIKYAKSLFFVVVVDDAQITVESPKIVSIAHWNNVSRFAVFNLRSNTTIID